MDRAEISHYVQDTLGHIVAKFHDTGKGSAIERINYVYAQGNPVAETGTRDPSYNCSQWTTSCWFT